MTDPYRALDAPRRARRPLTDRQRTVLAEIVRYYIATGEPCPSRFVARRLSLHHSTVQEHIAALRKKGALRSTGSPSTPVEFHC